MTSQPNASAMPSHQLLLRALHRHARRLAAADMVQHGLLSVALAGILMLLAVVADHVLPGGVPDGLRAWLLPTAGGVLLAYSAVAIARSKLRRLNLKYVARDLERRAGIHHNALVNAVLLREGRGPAYALEGALHQATRELTTHPDDEPDGRGARVAMPALLIGMLIAWVAYLLLSPKPVLPSVARMFGGNMAAPTATRIELLQPRPDDVLHANEAAELIFALHGHPADELRLELLAPNDPQVIQHAHTVRAQRSRGESHQRAVVTLPPYEVRGDLLYRARANDGRLRGRIPVHPQPDIAKLEVVLEPPAYTGRLPYDATGFDIEALRGTAATFRMQANTLLRDPVFVFESDGESRTRMQSARTDPRLATLSTTLIRSGRYRIEFADVWGHLYRDPEMFQITVVDDLPPAVRIVEPAPADVPENAINRKDISALLATAQDDVGLRRFDLVIARTDRQMRRPLLTAADTGAARLTRRVQLDQIALRPGEQVELWFEASDAHTQLDGVPAYQIGRSRKLILQRPHDQEGDEEGEAAHGAEEPGDDDAQDDPAARTDDATSQPADSSNDDGAAPSDEGAGSTSQPEEGAQTKGNGEDHGESGFADELGRFVERHGRETGEVKRRWGGGQRADDPESQDGQSDGSPRDEPGAGAPESVRGAEAQPGAPPRAQPEAPGRQGGQPGAAGNEGAAQAPPGESQPDGEDGHGGGGGAPRGQREASPEGPVAGDQPVAGDEDGVHEVPSDASAPGEQVAGDLEETGRANVLDLLAMLERGVEISEADLVEMGWPAEKAAAFVRDLEVLRAAQSRRARGAPRRLRGNTRPGASSVQRGDGVADEVRRRLTEAGSERDDLRRGALSDDEQVPDALRRLLEAYYRSLAQMAAEEGAESIE